VLGLGLGLGLGTTLCVFTVCALGNDGLLRGYLVRVWVRVRVGNQG
jgi:hypothetical protein